MRTRLILVAVAVCVIAGALLWLGPFRGNGTNVLFICVDTLRHDHLGYAGHERPV